MLCTIEIIYLLVYYIDTDNWKLKVAFQAKIPTTKSLIGNTMGVSKGIRYSALTFYVIGFCDIFKL